MELRIKNCMTSVDIKAVLDNLHTQVCGKRIRNIYHISEKLILFQSFYFINTMYIDKKINRTNL